MRSLTLKLALAFLAVGLTVAVLVAIFVRQQTQARFDEFVLNSYELDLLTELTPYYEKNAGWENINNVMIADDGRRPGFGNGRRSWAPVIVADVAGQGIPPADLPHIFNRFYCSEQSRVQNGESGLGLAIAQAIIEAHQGSIFAESEWGIGTIFKIRLPEGA